MISNDTKMVLAILRHDYAGSYFRTADDDESEALTRDVTLVEVFNGFDPDSLFF